MELTKTEDERDSLGSMKSGAGIEVMYSPQDQCNLHQFQHLRYQLRCFPMEEPSNASWEKELQVDRVLQNGLLPSTQGVLVLITRLPVYKNHKHQNMVRGGKKPSKLQQFSLNKHNKNAGGDGCSIQLHNFSA